MLLLFIENHISTSSLQLDQLPRKLSLSSAYSTFPQKIQSTTSTTSLPSTDIETNNNLTHGVNTIQKQDSHELEYGPSYESKDEINQVQQQQIQRSTHPDISSQLNNNNNSRIFNWSFTE